MRALLLLAHGSPRPDANDELCRVAEAVRGRGAFDLVQLGYLECNEPSIPEAIDRCADAGATEIVAVPYFLHTGTHVAQDLPELLEDGRARHPGIGFRMGDYIGLSPRLTDILAERAEALR